MLNKLKSIFPDAITEKQVQDEKTGKVSFEYALKSEFIDLLKGNFNLADDNQAYGLSFPGKKLAKLVASEPSYKTLKLKSGDGVNEETTENVYIEGDNLEVLKVLKNAYQGQIKMIYIDPPYNTGSDGFVYNDDFSETQFEYWKKLGYINEDGAKLVKENSENLRGYKHSGWLTFMYPRLKLARDLLRDDGVIFISIDDNEVHNLRLICDEIFGADNFVNTFYIQVRYGDKTLSEDNDFQKMIEHCLIYTKDINLVKFKRKVEEYTLDKFEWQITELSSGESLLIGNKEVEVFKPNQYVIQKVNSSIDALKETWATGSLIKQKGSSGEFLANYLAPRKNIDGLSCLYKVYSIGEDGLGYRYFTGPKKDTAKAGKFYSGVPTERKRELELGGSIKHIPISTFYDLSGAFGNCSNEGNINFRSGKKPIDFLILLMEIIDFKQADLVMDFFSGSASFAHATMRYNIIHDMNLKYSMVQVPCPIDEKKNKDLIELLLRLNKPANICEIGKERIRRAGKQILSEWQNKQSTTTDDLLNVDAPSQTSVQPDIGFKVFTLADSPLYQDNGNIDDPEFTQDMLGNLNFDYKFAEILYHYVLRVGVTLDKKVVTHQLDNFNYAITERKLLLLDNNLTCATAEKIVNLHLNDIDKLYYTINSLDAFTSYTEIDGIAKRHNLPCEVL